VRWTSASLDPCLGKVPLRARQADPVKPTARRRERFLLRSTLATGDLLPPDNNDAAEAVRHGPVRPECQAPPKRRRSLRASFTCSFCW
jgi:hypothetical protein